MAKAIIVDDSQVMRRHLKRIIEDMGHHVVAELEDGHNLLKMYEKTNPDFVTLDIVLPNSDGIEILKALIKEYPHAKVIMLSSMDKKHTVIDSVRYGARYFVIKPVDTKKFRQVVRVVLGEASEKQEPHPSESNTLNE
jgi:two-component system chemotaxis response regulator CheY